MLLRLGPHPFGTFANLNCAGLIYDHDGGNEDPCEWSHLSGLLQRHTFARGLGGGTFSDRQPHLGDSGIGGAKINADDARAKPTGSGCRAKFV